jgi:UDP-N-acetylmuramate dehydrogenase
MSRHTSWRVGGPVERFFRPADREDLLAFLAAVPADEPLTWVGLGSNLLVRDGGLAGTVICTTNRLDQLARHGSHGLDAECGVPNAKVARLATASGLAGAEFLAGIPGTVGGALAMNAGAFGGETWNIVASVETVDRDGRVRRRAHREFDIGYRQAAMPAAGEWFLSARFELQADPDGSARKRVRELLSQRGATQPVQVPNAGSVFRNPPGDHAARLIEACGLKGHCHGGACVSELHANFILNRGNATAADIEALIESVRARVHAEHGVELVAEVRVVGEPA